MAFRFVVALALFAACSSSPVLINGEYRDGRSFTLGEGISQGGSGFNQASASIDHGVVKAFGNNGNQPELARDGLNQYNDGQAFAKVVNYDEEVPNSRIQGYYPVPAPATVVTYQQNVVPAQAPTHLIYNVPQPAGDFAKSTALTNGGSADANAISGNGIAQSNTRSTGEGSASSIAHTGFNNIVNPSPAPEPVSEIVIDARNQGFYNPYASAGIGSASSNAKASGQDATATSSAKTGPYANRRSIHWHFGTAYDIPAGYAKSAYNAGYGAANANAAINNAGYGLVRSATYPVGGSAQTSANTVGAAAAKADANLYGSVNSDANAQGGTAQSSATNAGALYGNIRSAGSASGGRQSTYTQANNFGNAKASAFQNAVNSAASSYGSGSAGALAQNY